MPLRFPRPVAALVAIGTAAVAIGLSAVPVSADQVRSEEWWLNSLSVTGAWVGSQGYGVTVAVLSDGVDSSHPDLTGAVTAAPAPSGAPVAAGQYLGEQGTAIASLIAGRGHGQGNASGLIGVAPEASILSVPVTLPADDPQLGLGAVNGSIPAAIAAGIRYAVDHGASVIDLPMDPGQPSGGFSGAAGLAGGSAAEQSAVSYALAHNVVLVAPAGDNELFGDAPSYPAAYPGVIAVGAFDSQIDKAPWSSHQSYVTLTAAGAGVVAASNSGGYQMMNSTSAASAVTAGIVALIRSRYPGLSVANVRKALISTTLYRRPGGQADGSGYGAIDAAKALAAASTLATPAAARAGSGAQPRIVPQPPAAGIGAQGMTSQIVRAAEISAALLAFLLLVTAGYAATGRRRRGSAVPAQWLGGRAQSRYPHRGPNEADRMLEYFSAPVSAPDQGARELASPLGRPALSSGAWPGDDDPFALADPAEDMVAGSAQHGPASRAVSRRPAVAGTPPWDPAAPPEGDLPWADVPGRQTVPGQVVASGYPAVEQAEPELIPAGPEAGSPPWQSDSGPFSIPSDWADRTDWTTPPVRLDQPDRSPRPTDWSTPPARRDQPYRSPRPTDWSTPPAGPDQPDRSARQDTDSGPYWYRPEAPGSVPADSFPGTAAAVTGEHEMPRTEDSRAVSAAGDPSATAQHRSGLPIRQPRPVTPASMSPTGSLWNTGERSASLWERPAPATGEAGATGPDGPSGYDWDPAPAADGGNGQSAELAETRDERPAPGFPHYPEY